MNRVWIQRIILVAVILIGVMLPMVMLPGQAHAYRGGTVMATKAIMAAILDGSAATWFHLAITRRRCITVHQCITVRPRTIRHRCIILRLRLR